MKKVKIFAGSLALLAIVGVASAFSTKSSVRLYTLDTINNNCKFSILVDEGTSVVRTKATLSQATTPTISATFCDTESATFDVE